MTLGPVLFARSRLDRRTAVCFVVACCIELAFYGRSFRVPVVPWDVIAMTSPLVSVVPAIVALRPFDTRLALLELASGDPWRATLSRCSWYAGSLIAVCGSQLFIFLVADAAGGGAAAASVGARNALTYWALGLISGWLLGVDLCWAAPALLVTALVFFGRDVDRVPHGWALPLRDAGSGHALAFAATLAVVAGALYGWRDVSLAPVTREVA